MKDPVTPQPSGTGRGASAGPSVVRPFDRLHARNVVLHVPGRSSFAGDFRGESGIHGLMVALTARSASKSDFSVRWNLEEVLESTNHAVMFGTYEIKFAEKRVSSNKSIKSKMSIVLDFRGGKVADIWLHPTDQDGLDDFLRS